MFPDWFGIKCIKLNIVVYYLEFGIITVDNIIRHRNTYTENIEWLKKNEHLLEIRLCGNDWRRHIEWTAESKINSCDHLLISQRLEILYCSTVWQKYCILCEFLGGMAGVWPIFAWRWSDDLSLVIFSFSHAAYRWLVEGEITCFPPANRWRFQEARWQMKSANPT